MGYQRKPIPGYEGMYEIDTDGMVYAVSRKVVKGSGWVKEPKPFQYQSKPLKAIRAKGVTTPYWVVHLYDNNHHRRSFSIAMIVAHVFLGCPVMTNDSTGDKYAVFLKEYSVDCTPADLRADNLFWKQIRKAGVRVG